MNKAASLWFGFLVLVSVAIVGINVAIRSLSQEIFLVKALGTFNLAVENNTAAWWSGALLMVAGIHALDGYYGNKHESQRLARAWLCIAVVLISLSADEIASIHERVGLFGERIGIGVWPSLLPFALVMLALLVYAFSAFLRRRQYRRITAQMSLGFLLFGLTALQEFIEHKYVWEGGIGTLRVILEEGTELLGMLLLIRATMSNTCCFVSNRLVYKFATLEGPAQLRFPIVLIGVIIMVPFAVLTAFLTDENRGHPADWLAASLALIAALLAVRSFLEQHGGVSNVSALACGLLFVALSWASVAIKPDRDLDLPVLETLNLRVFAILVLFVALFVAYIMIRGRKAAYTFSSLMLSAGLFVFLVVTVKAPHPIAVYCSGSVVALLALYQADAASTLGLSRDHRQPRRDQAI